jgi:hypothetical protein
MKKEMILYFQAKLPTNEPTIKYHPSANTKSSNLNGKLIITGGTIIIPIDKSTLATTISSIKKGK